MECRIKNNCTTIFSETKKGVYMKRLFVTLVLLCGYINLAAMELALPYLINHVTLPSAPTIQNNIDHFLSLLSLITPHEIHHDTEVFFRTAQLDTRFGGKSV